MKIVSRHAVLALLTCAVVARAEDPAPAGDVNSRLDALQTEVKAMRQDMQKILSELQAIKAQKATPQAPTAQPARPAQDMLGKAAPEHKVKTYQGQDVTIGGKHDKVQYAFFYASWCGFCKRALPTIEKIYASKYKDNKDVEFVLINLDDREGQRAKTEQETVDTYKGMNLTMPVYFDTAKKVGGDYKVQSFPTSFVIGKDGTVQAVNIGGPTDLDQRVTQQIDDLLAGKTLVPAAGAAPAAAAAGAAPAAAPNPSKGADKADKAGKGD